MAQKYFSIQQVGFFSDDLHSKDQMSSDAEKISNKQYDEICAAIRAGCSVSKKSNGEFVFSKPQQDVGDALFSVKQVLRNMRSPMLDALAGIAGRAARAGNATLADEADALAVNLLAITDDAALNTATTYEEMQAAGVAAYKRIAATAGAELAVVFREITGA